MVMKCSKALALIIIIIASSCGDNEPSPISETTYDQLENYNPIEDLVQASLLGTVIDESENPVADAEVIHRGKQYITDENGVFLISEEGFDKNGSFITVHKEGYFQGSRRFYPQAGSTSYAYVQLMESTIIGQIDASTGGDVVGSDNIELSFSSNSIISADGATYTGTVSVAAKWLDPTAPNLALIMPGDLLGLDTEGGEMSLVSYGMMAVELMGATGEKLNLKPGSPATLSFPIPSALLGNAPETIPLWSFEEEQYGIWVEEGSARLEGEKYVGEVSHFSFWNCDAPFDVIEVCGQLVTNSRVPISNTQVCFESAQAGKRCGITDNLGFFSGKVPQDFLLNLSIGATLENCGFETIAIGPFSDSDGGKVDLGIIDLEALQIEEFTIAGAVVDCGGNPVANGYVTIDLGTASSTHLLEDDGRFSLGVLNCDLLDKLNITATDIDGLQVGGPIEKDILPALDCGTLSACGTEICITDNQFVGDYMLTVDGSAGLDYGPPYTEQVVTIVAVPGDVVTDNLRSFSSLVLPDIGGFGPYETTFQIECDKALYLLMDTNGLGCGGGGIKFGPAFDSNDQQITALIDIDDDSEIVLFFNPGYNDGGCIGMNGETEVKMVLTKQ